MRTLRRTLFPPRDGVLPSRYPRRRASGRGAGLLGLLLAACLPLPLMAQLEADTDPGPGPVFTVGAGLGSYGLAAVASFGFPAWKAELVVRAGGTVDEGGLGDSDAAGDAGVLLAFRRSGDRFWGRFGAGPGVVARDRPCEEGDLLDSCGKTETGIGLLGQVDGVLAFSRRFGLGVSLHGAVGSSDAAYLAASLSLFFGRGG